MDEANTTNEVRNKVSCTIEAGYKCADCGWETVVYGSYVPTTCFNCGQSNPSLKWKNKIHVRSVVEVLPIT